MAEARQIAVAVGALRAGVGAALIALPRLAGGTDATTRMLARTVGIRDLVLGLGTLHGALRGASSPWMRAGIASDVGDVVVAVRSRAEVGLGGALTAALIPLPVIAAGVAHESAARSGN